MRTCSVISTGYWFFCGIVRNRPNHYLRIPDGRLCDCEKRRLSSGSGIVLLFWRLYYRFLRPFLTAYAMRSARDVKESFCIRFALCDSTVRWLINSLPATSAFV